MCCMRAARRRRSSISSLLRFPTLHAAVVGGFFYRAGVGCLPFLLPLCLSSASG